MKSFIFILLSALFLGSAAYLGNMFLLRGEDGGSAVSAAAPAPKILALRLTADAGAGDMLSKGMVEWRPLPEAGDPRHFLTDAMTALDKLEWAVLTRAVGKGQYLEATHILRPGEPGYFKALLGEGMRARPVEIGNLDKFAALRPGDRIDLTLTYRVPNQAPKAGETAVRTLLENARVIDVQGAGGPGDTGVKPARRSLVLALSPADVERVSLAEAIGDLSIALAGRGSEAKSGDSIQPVAFSASDLFPDLKPLPVPVVDNGARAVRIMRGGEITVQTLNDGRD